MLKYYNGSKALQEVLGYQMLNFNHEGLGYTLPKSDKFKNLVSKESTKFLKSKSKSKTGVEPKGNYLVKGSEKVKRTFQGNFDPSYVLKRDRYGGPWIHDYPTRLPFG